MPENHPADVEKVAGDGFRFTIRSSSSSVLKRYNGIILVEINQLANRSEAEKIRGKATEILQTLAAFVGSSGRSVKILTRFTLE